MNADDIAHCLARNLFKSDLVVVDRCYFPGSECDLLVVTPRLQLIDVEIKISRADLRVDRHKAKWFLQPDFLWGQQHGPPMPNNLPREWPQNIWKHYYAMPALLWKPELAELCHPTSGIVTVEMPASAERYPRSPAHWHHRVVKRAKPCKTYKPIDAGELRKIAYLASCRMWDSYWRLDQLRRDHKQMAATAAGSAA